MHRFTRVPKRTITTVLVIALAAVAAYAGINIKSGPFFSIPAGSFALVTTGNLSGLGGSAHVLVDAVGTATGTCTNPSGANQPPGQNPIQITASGSDTVKPDHQGRADFSVTATPVPAPGTCPNGHWTVDLTSVSYNSATVTVTASGSQQLGPTTYTFTGAPANSGACTSDGSAAVTCTF